jgi:hypothetical protein
MRRSNLRLMACPAKAGRGSFLISIIVSCAWRFGQGPALRSKCGRGRPAADCQAQFPGFLGLNSSKPLIKSTLLARNSRQQMLEGRLADSAQAGKRPVQIDRDEDRH